MTRSRARLAGILFPLLLIAALVALLRPGDGPGDHVVRVELQNAQLLVPGHDVRVGGATVGRVHDVELTDRGTAMATLALDDDAPPVHADATASIRTASLLGDVYLALDPGRAHRPLTGPIPPGRTFAATRLQDVLDRVDDPTRAAVQTLLIELGLALDRRGADLNGAVLRLAPALREIDRIGRRLSDHDARLERLLDAADRLGGQLAPRAADLDRLLDGLDATLSRTARAAPALDRGLAGLPRTLATARTTLDRLGTLARTATPAAAQLRALAPDLRDAVDRLPRAASDLRRGARDARALATATRRTLRSGADALPRLRTAVATLDRSTPPVRSLAAMLDPIVFYGIKGIFAGLGGLAGEPGDGHAFSSVPGRNYFRGEVVLGCETFGVPTRPGCLADLLGQAATDQVPFSERRR